MNKESIIAINAAIKALKIAANEITKAQQSDRDMQPKDYNALVTIHNKAWASIIVLETMLNKE